MRPKNIASGQLNFMCPTLKDQLDPHHELYLLGDRIDWDYFDNEFSGLYSSKGRPGNSIRLMVSLLILKQLYNLSDEMLVEQQWKMNPYFQYFSGYEIMSWKQPCSASDLTHFRKRIGSQGAQKILKHSIDLHGKDGQDGHISVDTTVQEKNITYPTAAKLHKKIVDKCVVIARQEDIILRRSYKRTIKQLMREQYNGHHPKRRKKSRSAKRKIKTIAGRLIRELERKFSIEAIEKYKDQIALFKQVILQHRLSKDKIYSLHDPEVYCMSKGKAHKKYEYGCKASLALTQNSGIIVGAMTFDTNQYDGHTLEPALDQVIQLTGRSPKTATVDRGYKGKKKIGDTEINIPHPSKQSDSPYQKRKKRKKFRRRAAIEPIIGHLKKDHRVAINYLKGQAGDAINFILAASAFNYKKLMNKLRQRFLFDFIYLIELLYSMLKETIFIKKYFKDEDSSLQGINQFRINNSDCFKLTF